MIRKVSLLLVITVLFLPFLPLLIWSLAQGWYFPQLLPDQWTLRHWSAVLSPATRVMQGFGQSLLIAVLSTGLALLVGLPAGRALGLMTFPGKGAIKLLLLLPIIVSPLATLMGIQFVLIRSGLSGTLLGVVLVHLLPTIPYMTLVLSSVYANFDADYEAQARTLGASPIEVLWQVTLPMIAPGVLVGALFAFLISWNEFLLTFFVGGGRVFTLPMVLFTSLQGGNTGLTAAIAILSILPSLLFLLVSSRALTHDTAIRGLGDV
jgi:putative spermidine/putrescine transport system permease protein